MYSEQHIKKMRDFVNKLISNPCFSNETPLMVEENVILFLVQNYAALKATLVTPQFFPDLNWKNIEDLYIKVLEEEIDKKFLPQLQVIIPKRVDFTFINLMIHRSIDQKNFADQMVTFTIDILKRFEIRKIFDSIYKIITYNVIDKYIQEIFNKRSYIAFELEKVEKLRFSPELISSIIKYNMLVSAAGAIRTDIDDLPLQQKMNITDMKFGNSAMQKLHYERIVKQFMTKLSYFPQEMLNNSMRANMSFIEDPTIPATCRLAKIFMLLGKNFKPNMKIDKGAETFEKSWFGLLKKNYKYYGFDIKMIEELYRISAENFW